MADRAEAPINGFAHLMVERLDDWRSWLVENHAQRQSLWVVTWKKGAVGQSQTRGTAQPVCGAARPHVPYGDLRDEALCFGWIDSRPGKVDDTRSKLLMSPRRPGSGWSAVNKARIEALTAVGRMMPSGLTAIERAKPDGSWTMLDGAETGVPPAYLAAALTAAGSAETFARFPPSSRRAILEWIALAKRPETRATRIAETARLAALGLRANFPEARGR